MSRWLFLRFLGLIFLIAFASLWTQVQGLIGSRGISPAAEYLRWVGQQLGGSRWLEVPTLCWINSSDTFLHILCAAGTLLSLALIAGLAPRWTLFLLWVGYLSLTSAGDVFFQFQWDNLLLETALLSILLAPPGWRTQPSTEPPPRPIALLLLRWLLFKLMLLSGVAKLWSGDSSWRNLSALTFHYASQPLPTWIGYQADRLPAAVHSACVALMFAIELVVPFLIFGPRRARYVAAAVLTAFQVAIEATGNYGFFNLLAIALCVLLLDDGAFEKVLPARLRERFVAAMARSSRWERQIRAALAGAAVCVVLVSIAELRFWRRELPSPIERVLGALQPFRSINSYGLFAVMTSTRQEIEVEGSDDGRTWKAYRFKWKPGELNRAPGWVAPHMPRLDWQMWFAALGTCARNPWFIRFQQRVLEGAAEALALMGNVPFPASPPRYVRSVLYQYRFAHRSDRLGRRSFWERDRIGPYCPSLALEDGKLVAVSLDGMEER